VRPALQRIRKEEKINGNQKIPQDIEQGKKKQKVLGSEGVSMLNFSGSWPGISRPRT
jgi:hypothetical protein